MADPRVRRSFMWMAVLAAGMLIGSMLMGTAGAAPAGPPDGLDVREQNVDENVDGAIRVHEQGVADVNVTNSLTAAVSGTVSVDNFPGTQTVDGTVGATQDGAWNVGVNNFPATQEVSGTVNAQQSGDWNVRINGTPDVNVANEMTFTLEPASRMTDVNFAIDDDDGWVNFPVDPVLNASTIIVESNDEAVVAINGPLGTFGVGFTNEELGRMAVSLIQPYPVESIDVKCYQSTLSCFGTVVLIGG